MMIPTRRRTQQHVLGMLPLLGIVLLVGFVGMRAAEASSSSSEGASGQQQQPPPLTQQQQQQQLEQEVVCTAEGNCQDKTQVMASTSTLSKMKTNASASTTDGSSSSFLDQDQDQQQQPPLYCALYMAASTIPNAGMGIFTVEEKKKGETVSRGDICIPFIDMYWHNDDPIPLNPFKDYFWMGTSMGMAQETDSDDIEAYCPGLDCAVNTHPALNNVDKMVPKYDDSNLHRYIDPGVGAITPYHNGTTFVGRDIPAGGELFKDYGTSWFKYRHELFHDLPMWDDYESAEKLLKKMEKLLVKLEWQDKDDAVKEDLYKILKGLQMMPPSGSSTTNRSSLDEQEGGTSFKSLVLKALPATYQDAKWVINHGKDIPFLHQDNHVRSIDYLQKHGKCLDHIQNQKSTIPHAGRGAFAVRDLPKGTVVTASPLHHVEENFANMYNFSKRPDGSWMRIADQVIGKQLMLNYCYRHAESTVLFCPYGSGVNYINHGGKQMANVRIRWAENFNVGHNQSLIDHGSLAELLSLSKPKLAFDYVATRDIQQGEELLLDYGDVWQRAWDDHVRNWKPVDMPGIPAISYASARYMNAHFGKSIIRTEDEQEYDPYPAHLQIRCHNGLFNFAHRKRFVWSINDVGLPCRILSRDITHDKGGQVTYAVELEFVHEKQVTRTQRDNVVRSSIAFVDVPFTTDLHVSNAFRHPIGIPDDIFPEQWKNKPPAVDDDETTATSTVSAPDPPGEEFLDGEEYEYEESEDDDAAFGDEDEDDYTYY